MTRKSPTLAEPTTAEKFVGAMEELAALSVQEAKGGAVTSRFDYGSLTPGIRRTVHRMHSLGLKTSDSGDGVTNVAEGMEGALTLPHVHCMYLDVMRAIADSHRLRDAVQALGLETYGGQIQVTYDPDCPIATLSLYGVNDAVLSKLPSVEPGEVERW